MALPPTLFAGRLKQAIIDEVSVDIEATADEALADINAAKTDALSAVSASTAASSTNATNAANSATAAATSASSASTSATTVISGVGRAIRRSNEEIDNLFDKNGVGVVTDRLLRVSDGALISAGATGHNTSGICPVQGGQTIIATRQIGFNANGLYGLCWYDVNDTFISGLPASGSVPIAPGTAMVAPANAAGFRLCARVNGGDWDQMQVVYGSTLPTRNRTFAKPDRIRARREALQAVQAQGRSKRDFAIPDEYVRGAFRNTSNGWTINSAFGMSNRIHGWPGMQVVPTAPASGNLGVTYYDIDGNFLYTGSQILTGSIAAGSNQIVLTAADTYAPAIGTPASGTGIPANSYVTGRTSHRTPCTVTINNTSPGGGSGNYTFQGVLAGVPITLPEEACSVEIPMGGQYYWAQFLSDVPSRGDIFRGIRHENFGSLPLAGQETIIEGDSIMQSSAAGTGQPTTIPPGASATVGVMQYLLQLHTQADVVDYRGGSGKQAYQALAAYGPIAALSSGNFAEATLTGSVTSGSTSFSVTAGTPVAGRRVNGPGIPEQTYIVSVSGSAGSYTCVLSRAAFATTSGTYTIPPLRNYIDENITNSWGLATPGDNVRAYAQVQLGSLGDTWTPTLGSITFTAGSTAVTVNAPSIGAWANGMPVCGIGGQKTNAGTTLLTSDGGVTWTLSSPATAGGTATCRGGTYYGDLYDIHIRKVATWSPKTRQILLGALRRFDSTAAITNTASPDYAEGDPMNDLGVRLSQFNAAKKAFAERWGFAFIDTFNLYVLNSVNYSGRLDGLKLHPLTTEVVERYAPFLSAQLNNLPPSPRY